MPLGLKAVASPQVVSSKQMGQFGQPATFRQSRRPGLHIIRLSYHRISFEVVGRLEDGLLP